MLFRSDSAVLGLAHRSVHELGPDDLVVPAGFERSLGTASDAEGPKQGTRGTVPRTKDPVG